MTGHERNAKNLREIFSYRMIKSDGENNSVKVPYEGSVYDFVKSIAGNKYKKLYPNNTHRWAEKPPKPVCDSVEMFASDDVQKVLLQTDDSILFVPVFANWGSTRVYVKIPEAFATELENKILNRYRMKNYLSRFNRVAGVVRCDEGVYLRVTDLQNGMPDDSGDPEYVFQHYIDAFNCLSSFKKFYEHCEWFFNEDYYGGIRGIDRDLVDPFKDWATRLFEYVTSQDYNSRIRERYTYAYSILINAYEDERIAKEESERVKQAEAEARTQSYIDWIEQGNPVYKIFGWSWKGAQYNLMDPDEAISEIRKGRPFEIEYRTVNGEEALVLQYVGENDLY